MMIQIRKIAHLFWARDLMRDFSIQNWAKVKNFKALWAELTDPRDISDSFTVTRLGQFTSTSDRIQNINGFFVFC